MAANSESQDYGSLPEAVSPPQAESFAAAAEAVAAAAVARRTTRLIVDWCG